MENKEIGSILRKARENAGFSRELIAEMMGKSPAAIGHWETGHTGVDANALFALCRIYGVDMNEAFGFSEPEPPPKEKSLTEEMENLLDSMTPEQAALLLSIERRILGRVTELAAQKSYPPPHEGG